MPPSTATNATQGRAWQGAWGVGSNISRANLAGFLLHSCASIVFLVFLNSTQPFLIAQLGDGQRQGTISGNLVFADELLSLFLVLVWGSLADIAGTRVVAVTGYVCIAASLLAYTLASKPWPDLLFCRLAFAVGGSAVTSMLSGILNSYSASESEQGEGESSMEEANERTSLLGSGDSVSRKKTTHGRLAALAGLSTGCGALFAVFFLLRLPTFLAQIHDRRGSRQDDRGKDVAVRQGTREAFYIVTVLALVVAATLALMLKMDQPHSTEITSSSDENGSELAASSSAREERRQRMKLRLRRQDGSKTILGQVIGGVVRLAKGTLAGFSLAGNEADLPLAYLGSGLARACTIATTVFVPLLVVRFFYSSGQCADLPSPDVPSDELKKRCRQAFTVASILSGVIQLVALLLAPVIGWLCDGQTPARTLLLTTVIGTAAFLTMGVALPNDGDPRTAIAWIAAVGIGICQIGAIVASLAQCAKAKTHFAKTSAVRQVMAAEVAATAAQTGAGMSSAELLAEDEARKKQQQRARGGMASTFRRGMPSARGRSTTSSGMRPASFNVMRAPPAPGAVAGAYSATGGLSILVISKAGGALSDVYAPAAFLLMAGLSGITAIVAAIVVTRETRGETRRQAGMQ